MAWIPWVAEADATEPIASIYERARATFGFVPDVVKIFSLRPAVAAAQEALRQSLLGRASSLGPQRADMISAAIAGLNRCRYCTVAHGGNLTTRGEMTPAETVALVADWRALPLPADERAMLAFAEKLNATPWEMDEADVQGLRAAGFDDEQIYDIVLLTAYRGFVNRVIAGLGVTPERLRERFGAEYVDQVTATLD